LALGGRVPAWTRAQAEYRIAVVDFDRGEFASVGAALDRALAFCADAGCDIAGRASNLRARLALARGDMAAAETEGRRALDLNRRRDERGEQANSMWLVGELAMSRREFTQAEPHYAQALTLDRALAEPQKIVRDLLGLARCVLAQGRREAAADFARRARSAAQS